MKKIIRTSERCYICDFQSGQTEEEYSRQAGQTPSLYHEGLQEPRGGAVRFVFVDPRDGRPVCTHCSTVSLEALRTMQQKGQAPKTWRESNQELFKKWEKLLQEDRAQGAESGVETDQGTT